MIATALWLGLMLRANLWEWSMPVRFVGDINNGYNWGNQANRVGYLNVYETIGQPQRGKRYVDYAPLRLGVMSAWVQWLIHKEFPLGNYRTKDVHKTRDFHAPLLHFNTAMEGLAALAAAVLVWHIRRRSRAPAERRFPLALALVAGLLVWFNPASVYEAHTWPQWDVWPMPFFLFALYCGFRRWWLAAGLLIGVGSMLKGQILAVGWILPLWALVLGDWRGALRTAVGIATAIMVIGAPWALSSYDPTTKLRAWHVPAIGLTLLITLAGVLIPRRFSPALICGLLMICLWASMRWLGGTDYWYQSAFSVGTWNYHTMFMGPTSNLPALLATRYGWRNLDEVVFTMQSLTLRDSAGAELLRIGGAITVRTLMLVIFFGLSGLCAVRAAFLDKARDPRVLVALSLPWLMFFLIPCQIHERYLVFVSMCAATWVVCGSGITLLGVIVGGVAFVHVVHCNFSGAQLGGLDAATIERVKYIRQLLSPTHPGIAWLLLLALGILLYNVMIPRRPPALERSA